MCYECVCVCVCVLCVCMLDCRDWSGGFEVKGQINTAGTLLLVGLESLFSPFFFSPPHSFCLYHPLPRWSVSLSFCLTSVSLEIFLSPSVSSFFHFYSFFHPSSLLSRYDPVSFLILLTFFLLLLVKFSLLFALSLIYHQFVCCSSFHLFSLWEIFSFALTLCPLSFFVLLFATSLFSLSVSQLRLFRQECSLDAQIHLVSTLLSINQPLLSLSVSYAFLPRLFICDLVRHSTLHSHAIVHSEFMFSFYMHVYQYEAKGTSSLLEGV